MRETEDESTRKTACNEKCVEYPTTITITFKHCADYSGIAKSVKMKIMNKSTSKILSILLLLIASASWTGARADGGFWETKDGWSVDNGHGLYFFIDSEAGTAVLTNSEMKSEGSTKGANSYSGNIDIPETVTFNSNIYPVVGIQEYAFYNSTGLKTVAIPESITSIGSEAFSGCTGLEAITVDNLNPQYASIGGLLLSKNQKTLLYCPGGKSGECAVPTKVTTIANNAFLNCSNLTSVVLPDGVTSIGESAFQGCSSLASINMPASLTTIGDNAFYEARALSSKIVIPSGVLTIGASAFQFCTSLNNVVLSEGINEIKNNAFRNCTSLQSIQLPSTINSIGTYAFAYTGLTSIIIPASITEIKSGTFEGAKLTYVSLPENLTAIRNKAFYNNGTTISTLNIPASVTSIGDLAFDKTTINDIYVNNTPRHLQISVSDPFNKVSGMHIHVFTQMASIFSNSTNWSSYSAYFVGDIAIKHISTVTLDQATLTLPTNTLFQLNASIAPEDADVKDVVFTTSNPNIVAIVNEQTGQIKSGTQNGVATITCTAADGTGYYAECVVTVNNQFVPANNITLNKQNLKMNAGTSFQLKATISPANATYKSATWESSDETVATVDADGWVHAIKAGNATITAQSTDGYVSTTCDIVVSLDTYVIADNGGNYTNDVEVHVNTLTYNRTFGTTNYQALYVPFSMSYDDWKNDFYVYKIVNFHTYDKDGDGTNEYKELEIEMIKSGTLRPNHPYVIKAKTTGAKSIIVRDATLYANDENSIECSSIEEAYKFTGTYSSINGLLDKGACVIAQGAVNSVLNNITTLSPYRWYVQITDREGQIIQTTTNAKIVVIGEFEDETTGVDEVTSASNDNAETIYSTNSVKVKELQKGINIVKMANGSTKKIIVR